MATDFYTTATNLWYQGSKDLVYDLADREESGTDVLIDFFGNAYYRGEPYKMATHNHVFSLSGKIIRNEAVGTFLAAILSCSVSFPYKDMGTWPKIAAQSIPLPVDAEGKPDFDNMETFVLAKSGLVSARIDAFCDTM